MAGIPLTSGFTGKWAVFAAALSAGAWPVVVVAVLLSAVAAFFYVRVIVLMFFSEPVGDGPDGRGAVGADDAGDRRRYGGDAGAGRRTRARLLDGLGNVGTDSSGEQRSMTDTLALPVLDEDAGRAAARPDGRGRAGAAAPHRQRRGLRHRGGAAPAGRRRQAGAPAAGAARGRGGRAAGDGRGRRAAADGGLRRRADPPRVALPRRRDGRGRPAPRRRVRQRALGQPRRDPDRRLPVLEVLGAHRRARSRRACASRRARSPRWSRARSSRRSARVPARTRSSTTCGWSRARPAP